MAAMQTVCAVFFTRKRHLIAIGGRRGGGALRGGEVPTEMGEIDL